jgi:uncharacterized protein YcnI
VRILKAVLVAVAAAVLVTPAASAHVTLNPPEWEAGGFARFAVRVPNERPNADTTEITLRFPENVISASFQPVPGWTRRVQMAQLDQPVEQFGEQITERIASVTWTGGSIKPGEFQEFGVSFQVPEDAVDQELLFPALQTYSNGEVVRWIANDPEADSPAPRVAVLAPEEGEGTASAGPTTTAEEEPASAEAAPAAATDDDDGEGRATLALVLGIIGLLAGLAALAVALLRPRRPAAAR